MIQMLRDALSRVDTVQRDLARLKAKQVNSKADRAALQCLVDDYFRTTRPSIAVHPTLQAKLAEVDAILQDVLNLSHKRTPVATFRKLLSRCKATLIELEALSLTNSQQKPGMLPTGGVDEKILQTLHRLVPSAAASYEQALLDLDHAVRKSYRGPATDLREALRETLDHLAPDDSVTKQTGYKAEPNTHGPTMKQKVRYILGTRGMMRTLTEPSERAADAIDEAVGAFVRSVYTRSNVSTHTPTDRNEVLRIRDWVRVVMCELLEIR